MAAITLADLTKQFDDVTAVDSIDLTARDGEFLVLVGPSGCGKSTTLRMISGLETPTSGEIQLGAQPVTSLPPEDRNVAMVFQNYALYPHMSARRNMTFGVKSATDFASDEVAQRVEEAASILDIVELLDRKPSELSGGERQRVAIGRALVRDPDVFLLDEPLSNLDAKLRVQMRAELAQLHAELQTTTVYVTHDQTEAMTLGDRVAVMNNGEIEQVDPPQQLYDYPQTRFVAEFIGSPAMNTLPVTVHSIGEQYTVQLGAERIEVPPAPGLDELAGDTAVLGVRPEDIHAAADAPLEFNIQVTEPLGDTLLARGTIADQQAQIQLDPRSNVNEGDTLQVTVDKDRLHLFDTDSGVARYHSDQPQNPTHTTQGETRDRQEVS